MVVEVVDYILYYGWIMCIDCVLLFVNIDLFSDVGGVCLYVVNIFLFLMDGR